MCDSRHDKSNKVETIRYIRRTKDERLVKTMMLGMVEGRQVRGRQSVRGCPTSIDKKLVGLHALTYTERLELLGLERLESRRIRLDVLFAYKLLFGLTILHSDDFFILCLHVPEAAPTNFIYRVAQLMSASISLANVS